MKVGEHLNLVAGKLVKWNQQRCSSKLFWETMRHGGFRSLSYIKVEFYKVPAQFCSLINSKKKFNGSFQARQKIFYFIHLLSFIISLCIKNVLYNHIDIGMYNLYQALFK